MLSPFATNALAICVLLGLGVTVALWAAALLRRSPFSLAQSLLYGLDLALTRILWGAQVEGRLPVAPGRGAVVVCNHRSSIDPCFIAISTDRVVHWMIAREYWRNPILAWLFRTGESIPVGRGGTDTAATKSAIRLARRGEVVALFPEGRINTTDRVLLPGRPGAALIALAARVPVVPCYLSGSPYDGTYWGCLFMRARVRLRIGRPIDVSEFFGREGDRDVLEMLTKRLLGEIARLAGVPDYRPELAGRRYKPVF
jgi:1-acyl-sn-glycerol-3-phosphate acyltransferase